MEKKQISSAIKGRWLLRIGSVCVLGSLLFIALLNLYFVTTADPARGYFGIKPNLFVFLITVAMLVFIIGIRYMIIGYRREVKTYQMELKELEENIRESLRKESTSEDKNKSGLNQS
jgi:uncharacterized membrane protein (DUF106 family)